MERGVTVPFTDEQRQATREWARQLGFEPNRVDALIDDPGRELWMNDRYVVYVQRDDDAHVRVLSIRRQDRKAVHDWRHLQQIKNELAGTDAEAVELYPAEARLIDTANQYWLWCLPPGEHFPLGFAEDRTVTDDDGGTGARQRAREPGVLDDEDAVEDPDELDEEQE
jgi:hypothetical protein